MPTTIKLKNSVTTTNAPSSLVQGEVAINITDKKVWVGNAAGTPIQLLGAGGSASFGALTCTSLTNSGLTSGRVTYASTGGLLADSANFTFNGTTVTMANDASISGLTVGKGGGSVATNTAVGYNALAGSNSGTADNTAIGYQALLSNTTGYYNVAVGRNALAVNTTGAQLTAVGRTALAANTTGANNTAVGQDTLSANTTGGQNTGIGLGALAGNTTASNNTAVGYQAGYANTTGIRIVAVGNYALYGNTTGNYNVAMGYEALAPNTTGSNNTAIGHTALQANTTASNNTAVGYQAGYSNTTGTQIVAIGYQALYNNTTNSASTAVGWGSLQSSTGIENTAIGKNAGNSTTTGYSNVYVGNQSGNWNVNHTTGYESVFIGNKTSPAAGADNNTIVIGAGTTNGKGSTTGFINAGGGGVYQGNNSASWSTTSDKRLKKNIVDNTDGLNKITALQVRNFEYRLPEEITELAQTDAILNTGVQLGVIAQEIQQVLPSCVKTESTGVMSVDTSNLTFYLINAVKELNAKITALENK